MPSFDSELFAPERYYDKAALTEQVVWPIVNHVWAGGDNWLKESECDFPLKQPFKRRYQGEELRVMIEAECCELEIDGRNKAVHNAAIKVESEPPQFSRPIILQAAKIALSEELVKGENIERPEDFAKFWPEDDDDELFIVNGVTYRFSTHFEVDKRYYRRIVGATNTLQLPYSERELEHMDSWDYDLADVERIEAVSHIIRAPKTVQRALEVIKSNPADRR
jgi:hypothetical protein